MTKTRKAADAKEEPIHIADAFHVGVMLSEMESYENGMGNQCILYCEIPAKVGCLIKPVERCISVQCWHIIGSFNMSPLLRHVECISFYG